MISVDRSETLRLTASAQAGSEAAFAALVRGWNPRLMAHAWRLLGDREAARDAAQGAWLEIARGLGTLRDPQAFPAWAYRITSRQAAGHIRRRQADRRLATDLERESLIADTPQEADDGASAALQQAIRALPPDQRAAIALHHFEGLSVAETAVALDAPVGTIKTRLMHARLKLKAALEGEIP